VPLGEARQAEMPYHKLAKQSGISLSSVKRLLREHRARRKDQSNDTA